MYVLRLKTKIIKKNKSMEIKVININDVIIKMVLVIEKLKFKMTLF